MLKISNKDFNNMEIIKNKTPNAFCVVAKFQKAKNKSSYEIYEDSSNLETTIFFDDKSKLTLEKLSEKIDFFFKHAKRDYEIDASSFVTDKINEKKIIELFIEQNILVNGKNFNKKTVDQKIIQNHKIITSEFQASDFHEVILLATQMNSARYFQDMPANLCTIDFLTNELENMFSNSRKVKVQILNKKNLEKLGMNLVLAVNSGSKQEAKVVIAEYNNNPTSRKKIAIIGKGIIFDTGGYDIKRLKNMSGMKYDMSGAIIAAHILDTIDKLKLKVNVSIVLPITDNLVDSNGILPESIVKSMSGKTIEIANTDAEGRLILADGLTYASIKLKASLLIDISTLTGSVVYALGSFYTGVWSSSNRNWNLIEDAANKSSEKVWRMPLDKQYISSLSKNTFADIQSCSNVEYSDCNIAAAWLQTFTDNKEYIHIDIAGTADIKEKGKSPMIKTVVEFIKNY